MQPQAVLEAVLYTDDLPAAERFYTEVLGLDVHQPANRRQVFLRCGPTMVLLFDPTVTANEASSVGGATIPTHGARGPGHLALRVAADSRQRWRDHFSARGVAIESEVEWPAGGWSIYLRDPAGNSIELATAELWGID
ncbi:glyoxalase/bleomycin resistance/extradiol dioxygenase family protein [bacterium]|nr:glyoxalase/bleomycin resistance/extradiol dioxygenase family protein [bacterium]